MLELTIYIVLIVSLILAFLGDLLQYAVRIGSSLYDLSNLSTHMSSLSMLINRVGAALSLLVIGYMIDMGVHVTTFALVYSIFGFFLSVMYFTFYKYINIFLDKLRLMIVGYYKVDLDSVCFSTELVVKKNLKFNIAAIYFVSLAGFFLPSIAAAYFPEYRATLLQTGFLLNSFATLYFALVIEKNLALILCNGSNADKIRSFSQFMFSRMVGSIISFFVFLLISIGSF